LSVKIISVGKPDKIFLPIIEKYVKKCNKYFPLSHKFTRDVKSKNKDDKIKQEEREILKLAGDNVICILDEKGKSFKTCAFANFIKKHVVYKKDLCFVIGGAYGLSHEIKQKAEIAIRLSDLTMQHDIALSVLLEQIYRSFTIIKGIPYHK
jgi:23S rRNA (pseudouridine1915-N3)-methyltransferase